MIVIDNSSCRMLLSCLTIKFNYKFMKKKENVVSLSNKSA